MASLKPLHDRVIVKRTEAEEKTAGGIVLPDSAKDKPRQGTVISVGPGKIMDNGEVRPLEVKKGDEILFGSYAGTEVKMGTEEYMVLSESEILAVIESAGGKKKK